MILLLHIGCENDSLAPRARLSLHLRRCQDHRWVWQLFLLSVFRLVEILHEACKYAAFLDRGELFAMIGNDTSVADVCTFALFHVEIYSGHL